jgi:DNA excision repair protein ERCC-4
MSTGTATIVIDSREQTPLRFTLPTTRATLTTGDYSLVGLEHLVTVERKSLPDLLACIGHGRDRFKRELARMRAFPFRVLVVEASFADIEAGTWRSQLKPSHVSGAIASWTGRYALPTMLVGSHAAAGRFVERFLINAARQIEATHKAAVSVHSELDNEPRKVETQ